MWGNNGKAIALQVVLLVGLLVFARGFLPPSRTQLGISTKAANVPPQFDRLVFMVVDAMRSDFLFSDESNMSEVHEILRNGNGYGFTAFSDPPTVTLPRLKGLTTGASANFLDAVINIAESDSASTLENQDSWVEQLYNQNKTLHLYGDDTWLNLFPGKFHDCNGVSSFYVADFTEVDNNVTRHLDDQLKPNPEKPWDVLVLHYLGLDHIGHKGGPRSPHMPQKQREMSGIISRIYESLDDSTLFVLLGDHGMNDVGNHGGASEGETSAALAMFAKKFRNNLVSPLPTVKDGFTYYSKIRQVDLVPTLAALLGFPIPKNSLGIFITDLLSLWSAKDQEVILSTNCEQLELFNRDQCTWSNLKEQQQHLMRISSAHLLPYMYGGVFILFAAALLSGIFSFNIIKSHGLVKNRKDLSLVGWWVVIPVLYLAGMMGSSTVEEEHYIWYWAFGGLLACMIIFCADNAARYRLIGLLLCYRIMRGWNTAGQKWAVMTDTADIIASHPKLKLVCLLVTYLFVACGGEIRPIIRRPFLLSSLFAFAAFKILSEFYPISLWWMILVARFGFFTASVEAILGSYTEEALTLICLMQTKQENTPLWIFFVLSRKALVKLNRFARTKNVEVLSLALTLTGLCFEYVSFFANGGSNSLASIDLSNAYNGVSGYNIPLVALLTYLGNWAPSLYFSSIKFLPYQKLLRAWFHGVALTAITIACLILRGHLFIWTVFSPKLLYAGAWLVFHEILATNLATWIVSSTERSKKVLKN